MVNNDKQLINKKDLIRNKKNQSSLNPVDSNLTPELTHLLDSNDTAEKKVPIENISAMSVKIIPKFVLNEGIETDINSNLSIN